jgi:hypothetical protein
VHGLNSLFSTRLPINRKERYYTGTVLPAIVGQDNFKHFDRFLRLLKIESVSLRTNTDCTNFQFFTEYGFVESIFGEGTLARFVGAPSKRDTPDIVILIEGEHPVLVAIEAKMFDRVSHRGLVAQMARQKLILDYLARIWPGLQVVHTALLPACLRCELQLTSPLVITWEDIIEAYSDLSPGSYMLGVLQCALEQYETLRSTAPSFRDNADAKVSGNGILFMFESGTLPFRTMGRQGGLSGSLLASDLRHERWKTRIYEVSANPEPANSNWFTIEQFVELIHPPSLN